MNQAVLNRSTRRGFLKKTGALPFAGALIASAVSAPSSAHDSPVMPLQGSLDPNATAQAILDLPDTIPAGSLVAAFGGRSVFRAQPGPLPAFSFNWGDSTAVTGPLEISSHVYDRPGRFTVTMTMITPQGQELRASKSITVTQPLPPANALALLAAFTQKVTFLPLDSETASSVAAALQAARQHLEIAKRYRPFPITGTLNETSVDPTNDLIADTHLIDAANSVEIVVGELVLAKERNQINDGQFEDIILAHAVPLMFAITDSVRPEPPDEQSSLARRGIRYRLCVAKCRAIAAVILAAILVVVAAGVIVCRRLISGAVNIPVIGFILILLCAAAAYISLQQAIGVLNRWLSDCISRC